MKKRKNESILNEIENFLEYLAKENENAREVESLKEKFGGKDIKQYII